MEDDLEFNPLIKVKDNDDNEYVIHVASLDQLFHAGKDDFVFVYEKNENGDEHLTSKRKGDLTFIGIVKDFS